MLPFWRNTSDQTTSVFLSTVETKAASRSLAGGFCAGPCCCVCGAAPLPAKIYAGEGCAQVLFFESDEVCETSYKDRDGKYQGQRGVTLPKA